MARAHTAGKEKHGNMATGLVSFACLFFFLFRNPCVGKKEFLYADTKFSSNGKSAI
jgi:hypothetical protein